MSLAFDVIEAAVATWLAAGTGLPSGSVFTKKSKVSQPPQPYVTFEVKTPAHVGGRDEWRWSNVPSPPAGAELLVQTAGQRELIVSVQCFTQAIIGAADTKGNFTAKDYLSRAQSAAALPSRTDAFNAVGMCFIDVQHFVDFSEPMGPVGAGRASMDVRFRVVDSASETNTYIQNVGNQGTNPNVPNINPTGTFTPN